MAQLHERIALLGWDQRASRSVGAPWHADADASVSELARVLIIENSDRAEPPLYTSLARAGFIVRRVRSGTAAVQIIDRESCDLVLLVGEPAGMSGFQLCRELRRRGQIPIIFVGVHDSLPERLLAFDLGADDDISSAVAAEEVERRVRAVLRRARPASHDVVLEGPSGVELQMLEHVLHVHESSVAITTKEFDLLRLLLERRGEVLPLDSISLAVWGYKTMGSRNFVEAHISRLRAKLGAAGAHGVIETVRGFGYVIR